MRDVRNLRQELEPGGSGMQLIVGRGYGDQSQLAEVYLADLQPTTEHITGIPSMLKDDKGGN